MAQIRPVRALRFRETPEPWPRTDGVAPLDPNHPATALARPEGAANDRSKFVRFAHSAARLVQLRKSGDLVVDDAAEVWPMNPGRLALAMADDLVISDQPTPAEIEARKRLLEATRTFFEIPVGREEGEKIRIEYGAADVCAARALVRRPPAWVPVLILSPDDQAPSHSVGVFVSSGDNP